jgi:hypothetical protein
MTVLENIERLSNVAVDGEAAMLISVKAVSEIGLVGVYGGRVGARSKGGKPASFADTVGFTNDGVEESPLPLSLSGFLLGASALSQKDEEAHLRSRDCWLRGLDRNSEKLANSDIGLVVVPACLFCKAKECEEDE